MKAALVMFKPDGERRDFPVSKPIMVLGRKHTCDLRIPLSSVSREHAQVERRPDGFYIRDLGSSNGTYHNERRVHEQKLEAGDALVIGPVHFTVVIDGRPRVVEPVATVLPEGSRVMDAAEASSGSRAGGSRAGGSAEGSRRGAAGAGSAKDRAVVADPSKGKVAERGDEEVDEQALIEAMEVEFEDAEEEAMEEEVAVKDRPETPADAEAASHRSEASPDAPTGIPGGERDGESDPIAALESLASASEDEDEPEERLDSPEREDDAEDIVRLRDEEDDEPTR